MNQNPNSDRLDAQFLGVAGEVAGIKLQPLSLGVITCARKLDLKMVIGTDEQKRSLDPARQQYELMALVFLLATPRAEFLPLVEKPDEFRKAVEEFECRIPLAAMPEIVAFLTKISEDANLAAVKPVDKPEPEGAADLPQPPKNA